MIEKQSKLTGFLEKLFWLYLFINPLLDIFNGFYINLVGNVHVLDVEFISTLGVTPSLIIRLIFLAIFALYILLERDWKNVIAACIIGLAWALSVVSEYLNLGRIAFFIDAQYMARFCYNIVVLMVFSRIFANRWGHDGKDLLGQLNTVIIYTMIVLSLAVLIPAIFGLGYSTYADIRGYRGNRGFFYAGNDITAILSILLPILIALEMCSAENSEKMSGKAKFAFLPALAAALGTNAMMVIGSKTAFLALLISYLAMLAAGIIAAINQHKTDYIKGFIYVALTAVAVCLLVNLIAILQHLNQIITEYGGLTWKGIYSCSIFSTVVSSVNTTEELLAQDIGNSLLNGRHVKLADQLAQFRAGGIITWLFGLGRGSQEVVIEMDLFEVLCYYGIFGFAAMLWLYLKLAVDFLKNFFKKLSLASVAAFLAIGMTAGYLAIAGHVLFSVTSGFYFSFAILFSRVLFAERPQDILLWKTKA